jgi:type IV pilus assembly protein PilM
LEVIVLKDLFKKKVPQMIGLDIGTRFVKAVLLSKEGEQYKVQGFACEPITGNAFVERELKDFDALGNALKKIKKTLKVKNKFIATAVSGASVISKVVFMDPNQSDYELESQIEIEADSLIPYPLDEVYLDFEELGESTAHIGKIDVLLSAAHKDMINNRITLLREMEFEPRVMDIEGYALGSALSLFCPDNNEKPICCVNIGASQLQVCAILNGQVIYSKEHSFGLDSLIQDLSIIHALERGEAERQLLNDELPANWKQDSYPLFLASLQQQIVRAMQMYISTAHVERPEKLLISGGGSVITNIAADLESELSVKVEVFNPFADMQVSDKLDKEELNKLASQMAIAAGLASRSFNPWHI